ncbi:helix-turn-helix domain-containing protein [Budviciaceae bacterium BWR-B9]|uniref:Helix-turn-helix domain-containing protein n=1 Tax=Limnobaculum allomyrinae TaxID=2791986 RepID=A0ABS1IP49_9GAMM|nr:MULTISPECIES: helix-turn-helix domain-containing protein [Limnobaculum]MBK5143080.1 helix-turn-helix domain-containing protein [Limnobaculum allomyrinae]MBV7693410.1 helix-turn-helix domain-containing protein [Limnobaculum sp. M2-1]
MKDRFPDYDIHLQRLIDAFARSDKIKKVTVARGNTYIMSDEICCIRKGIFSVYMNQGERLLSYGEGQAIIGLTNFYSEPVHFYIKPGQTSTLFTLTTEEARQIIKTENLSQSIGYILANNTNAFFQMYEKVISPNNYTFIRLMLMDLDQATDAIKASVTVASYIIKRSGLSRSYVMLVLSELRKGGYINMNDGKLTSITSLPERF